MGFKDGTNNVARRRSEAHAIAGVGRTRRDQPAWMRGGSYLVVAAHQDAHRAMGPRLPRRPGGHHRARRSRPAHRSARDHERDPVDLEGEATATASLVIAGRRPHPAGRAGRERRRAPAAARLLVHRRDQPADRGPRRRAVLPRVHARPARASSSRSRTGSRQNDALNEYIEHTASALFAVPPGVERGGYIGETLFGA